MEYHVDIQHREAAFLPVVNSLQEGKLDHVQLVARRASSAFLNSQLVQKLAKKVLE